MEEDLDILTTSQALLGNILLESEGQELNLDIFGSFDRVMSLAELRPA